MTGLFDVLMAAAQPVGLALAAAAVVAGLWRWAGLEEVLRWR